MSSGRNNKNNMLSAAIQFCIGFAVLTAQVHGHARFMEPPSRASLWRVKNTDDMIIPFKSIVEANYNDNSLFCGGREVFIQNGEKCAICGDAFNAADKRHEFPGKYAKGIIVRKYNQGETIDVTIQVTAKHEGDFQFKLCPWNNMNVAPTQDCFDDFPLQFEDGSDKYGPISETKTYNLKVKLPDNVVCDRCIMQWQWRTGNSWGVDANGSGLGFGPQETYYGCADVAITSNGVPPPVATEPVTTTTAEPSTIPTSATFQLCHEEICNGNEGFRFENPRNRNQFYECNNGALTLQTCDGNTKYRRGARECR